MAVKMSLDINCRISCYHKLQWSKVDMKKLKRDITLNKYI